MNTLQLVGYDLETLGHRSVYEALEDAVTTLALPGNRKKLCYNVPGGPWLLKTDKSIEQVLIEVDEKVAAALKDAAKKEAEKKGEEKEARLDRRLLVLELAKDGEALVGAHRGFKETADWLDSVGFHLSNDGWYSPPRVLAIRFALHNATPGDYSDFHMAIWHRFHECCNPLHTEWFVRTSQPPDEVCRYLEPFLPNRNAQHPDELLVLHLQGPAAESGLERVRADAGWLWENGIPVKHRWGPEPVARKSAA